MTSTTVRHHLALLALACGLVLAWSRPTRACGAGFGAALEVQPSQTIAIAHRNGQETYVFSPQFCGVAQDFGMILPIPKPLIGSPTLAEAALFTELADLSKPEEVVVERKSYCDYPDAPTMGAASTAGERSSVRVVSAGQVGDFDWSLLTANSIRDFTDWLDANGYPYDAHATQVFSQYVKERWYFVAFKVRSSLAKEAGQRYCGDLGPISLTFPSEQVIVPARIAAAGSSGGDLGTQGLGGSAGATGASRSYSRLAWRVFVVAPEQVTTTRWLERLYFAGSLSKEAIDAHPQLQRLALPGERLTALDLSIDTGTLSQDIELLVAPKNDHREQVITFRDLPCQHSGCSMGWLNPAWPMAVPLGWALLVMVLRRFSRANGR